MKKDDTIQPFTCFKTKTKTLELHGFKDKYSLKNTDWNSTHLNIYQDLHPGVLTLCPYLTCQIFNRAKNVLKHFINDRK